MPLVHIYIVMFIHMQWLKKWNLLNSFTSDISSAVSVWF